MWDIEEPGYVFTPSSIGNVAWEKRKGKRVIDGSLLYPLTHTDTSTVAVVGHTGCGAVTAAYRSVVDGIEVRPEPVRERIERLVPVVEEALEMEAVDASDPDAVDALVEYNVHEQIDFLLEDDYVPDDVEVYGFVYDIHATYSEARGRTCLVNVGGERDTDAVRARLPDRYGPFVGSLLE
jgi:carbonic anhydrase